MGFPPNRGLLLPRSVSRLLQSHATAVELRGVEPRVSGSVVVPTQAGRLNDCHRSFQSAPWCGLRRHRDEIDENPLRSVVIFLKGA
jgi:hypothetical protein